MNDDPRDTVTTTAPRQLVANDGVNILIEEFESDLITSYERAINNGVSPNLALCAMLEWESNLFKAERIDLSVSEPYDFDWKGSSFYLAIHDILRRDGETYLDKTLRSTATNLRRKMAMLPAGCSASGWTNPARKKLVDGGI